MALRAGGREQRRAVRADSRAQRPVGSPAKPSGARGRLRAAGIAWVRAPAEQPGQRRHGPRACGGASAAPGRRHLPRLSAEGSWRAAPATPGRARRRPGQRWARTSGRCRPLNCSAPRISNPCTLSFRARGTLFTILASLKSNQKIQKVCKGPPSPPLLVFARLLLWGTPTPRGARPSLRRFFGSPLVPRTFNWRSGAEATEFPFRLWDSEPGTTGKSGGDAEQVESCPFVTGDLAAQGSAPPELSRAPR